MTNPDYTHLALVVDRSGSMSRIASDMNGAISELFKQQAELAGDLRVDIWTFDDTTEHRFVNATLDAVRDQDYVVPRGSTALNDAVARAITELGEQFLAMDEGERPGKVVFAIITDGEENASKEFSGAAGQVRVKGMIEVQRSQFNWEFLFFGTTDIDAVRAAAGYGISGDQTLSFAASSAGTAGGVTAASAYLGDYRGSGVSRAFTQEERDAALGSEQ